MPDHKMKILVTRLPNRAKKLILMCKEHGITAVAIPLTEQQLTESARTLPNLGRYDWVIITSVNVVKIIANQLNIGLSDFADDVRFATVGKATAEAVAAHYQPADIIAEPPSSSGLSDTFIKEISPDDCGNILWICPEQLVNDIAKILTDAAYSIDKWQVYKTISRNREILIKELEAVKPWDAVLFAAPSAVEAFSMIFYDITAENCIAIGDTTANALVNRACSRITIGKSPDLQDVILAIKLAVGL